jgi:hypothetical protein
MTAMRTNRTNLKRAAMALAGTLALAAACTKPAEQARPEPARSAGETTTTTAPRSVEADTVLAKGALLVADIPRGHWTQTANEEVPVKRAGTDVACADPPAGFELYDDPALSATVAGALFVEEGAKRTFREVVHVFASVEEAQRFGAAVRDPKFRTCVEDTFMKVADKLGVKLEPLPPPGQTPPGIIHIGDALRVNDFIIPPAGDEAIALEFKSAFNSSMPGGASTIIYTFTRVGRAYVQVELNCDRLPTADEVHDFADVSAKKLAKALAKA